MLSGGAMKTGQVIGSTDSTAGEAKVKLKGKELRRVATKWAAIEEFSPRFDNWPADAGLQMLESLVTLAQRAISERKSLLMWMSL